MQLNKSLAMGDESFGVDRPGFKSYLSLLAVRELGYHYVIVKIITLFCL